MQQFPFIDVFKSVLHVSGDNFAHPQEHFNCIYSFWYNALTLLPTGGTVEVALQFHLNRVTGGTEVPPQPCHRWHCSSTSTVSPVALQFHLNRVTGGTAVPPQPCFQWHCSSTSTVSPVALQFHLNRVTGGTAVSPQPCHRWHCSSTSTVSQIGRPSCRNRVSIRK
jgi:Ser-tRNA(Ala) deacylase AlaX